MSKLQEPFSALEILLAKKVAYCSSKHQEKDALD